MITMTGSKYMTNSEKLRRYLNSHSLARKVLYVDELPQGAVARYKVDGDDNELSDIFCFIKKVGHYTIITGEEAACTREGLENQFYAPTFDHHIETKDGGYLASNYDLEDSVCSDDMPQELFDKLKIQFLNRQENLFLDFIEEVTRKVDRYVCCETVEEAVDEIKKRDYKHLWIGKDFEGEDIPAELHNQESTNSSNLKGFILTHEDDLQAIGYFVIRCDACILPSRKTEEFVSYEDIAIFVVGKSLTYIEVKNNDSKN